MDYIYIPDIQGTVAQHQVGYHGGAGTIETDVNVVIADGTFTLDLPTASGVEGKWYEIKNKGTGVVTIDPASSETIDGDTTFPLYSMESISIVSDGTNWWIL